MYNIEIRKALKEKFYNSKGCYDSKGNYFNSYREAGRYYGISANTVKRDCLGLTTRIEDYKGRKRASNISQVIFFYITCFFQVVGGREASPSVLL